MFQPLSELEKAEAITRKTCLSGRIGYLEGDFGINPESTNFFSRWHDENIALKRRDFRLEFDDLVNKLRQDIKFPLLVNYFGMQGACYAAKKYNDKFEISHVFRTQKYAFKVVTDIAVYYIRCDVRTKLDSQFYIFCYNPALLEGSIKKLERRVAAS